jgi:DNA invertase Pin-like site-specific DNA recombinase
MNLVKPELHIYLRVSSEAQEEEGFGLITQEKSGKNCAIKHKFKPVIHKEGAASSFNENFENRPVLKRLLALCE